MRKALLLILPKLPAIWFVACSQSGTPTEPEDDAELHYVGEELETEPAKKLWVHVLRTRAKLAVYNGVKGYSND